MNIDEFYCHLDRQYEQGNLSNTEYDQQRTTAGYIRQLAQSISLNVDGWNILKAFGDPEHKRQRLITDRKRLNKLFYKMHEQHIERLKPSTVLDEKTKEKIKNFSKEFVDAKINGVEQQIQNSFQQISNLSRQINSCQRTIKELGAQIVGLKASAAPDEDLVKEIEKVADDGFWKFEKVTGEGLLYLSTANSVSLRHDELDQVLDFGRFMIK